MIDGHTGSTDGDVEIDRNTRATDEDVIPDIFEQIFGEHAPFSTCDVVIDGHTRSTDGDVMIDHNTRATDDDVVPDIYEQIFGEHAPSSTSDVVIDHEKPIERQAKPRERQEPVLQDGSNILELLGMVEPGQDATSGESGAEDLSSLSSDGEDSDAEDVFQLNAMKVEDLDKPYTNFSYTDGNKQRRKL